MPYIRLETNIPVPGETAGRLVRNLSAAAAELTGKPEKYVQAVVITGLPMVFGGSSGPCAYVEVKSIGLPEERCPDLSTGICGFLEKELEIACDRVYVEFTDVKGPRWGFNGGTFQ